MTDPMTDPGISVKPPRFALLQPMRVSRSFTALWSGQTTSAFGDSILSVMLPIIVYQIGHSTLAMGLVMTLNMLPQVILLPFAGLLVDRVPRVPLMMLTDGVRFLLLAGIALLAAFNHLTLHTIYGFAVIYGAMAGLFNPAYSAVRAQIFTPEIRNAANSLTQISSQSVRLIGPSLGGVIISAASAAIGLIIDAVTFVVSIISLIFVKTSRQPRAETPSAKGLRAFLYELSGGARELKKHPWLWVTVLAFSFANLCAGGITSVLLPWLIKVHLHDPAYDFGLVTSATAIGAMVSAMVMGSRSHWHHRGIIAYAGVGMWGLAILGMAFVANIPGLMVLAALSGAGVMAFAVIWEGSLQELVPEEAFGRVSSIDMFGSFVLMPIGYLLAGWLAQVIGGVQTYIGLAAVNVLIAICTLLVPSIRKFD